MDLVSRLLRDGGGRVFFASTLNKLNPRDLKACRLVCWEWNVFVRDEVWGSKAGRAKLEKKLVARWMNSDPIFTKIGEARGPVYSIFCDSQHVFCGQDNDPEGDDPGTIGVYTLSGEWVRNLDQEIRQDGVIAVGEGIVAAVTGERVVTVWSTQGDMNRLHTLDLGDFDGSVEEMCVVENTMSRCKVAVLTYDNLSDKRNSDRASLVVTEMNEVKMWEDRILTSFHVPGRSSKTFRLAGQGKWIAVAWHDETSHTAVALWHGDKKLPDAIIPTPDCDLTTGFTLETQMEKTKIILSLSNIQARCQEIRVYNIEVEATSTKIELIKRIKLNEPLTDLVHYEGQGLLVSNNLVLGCSLWSLANHSKTLILYEKRKLLDQKIPPEDTRAKQLKLPENYHTVNLSSTHIVLAGHADLHPASDSDSNPDPDGLTGPEHEPEPAPEPKPEPEPEPEPDSNEYDYGQGPITSRYGRNIFLQDLWMSAEQAYEADQE